MHSFTCWRIPSNVSPKPGERDGQQGRWKESSYDNSFNTEPGGEAHLDPPAHNHPTVDGQCCLKYECGAKDLKTVRLGG